jgi:hypothetical protein
MMLGVWYPMHYLVAAIDPTDGAQAVQALLAAGFERNSVRLESGARVGQICQAIYAQRTPLQRLGAAVSHALTDEGLMSQNYFEAAEAEASLIAVLAPEPQLVQEARQILAAHDARHMRFYDKCITDLTSTEPPGVRSRVNHRTAWELTAPGPFVSASAPRATRAPPPPEPASA